MKTLVKHLIRAAFVAVLVFGTAFKVEPMMNLFIGFSWLGLLVTFLCAAMPRETMTGKHRSLLESHGKKRSLFSVVFTILTFVLLITYGHWVMATVWLLILVFDEAIRTKAKSILEEEKKDEEV